MCDSKIFQGKCAQRTQKCIIYVDLTSRQGWDALKFSALWREAGRRKKISFKLENGEKFFKLYGDVGVACVGKNAS